MFLASIYFSWLVAKLVLEYECNGFNMNSRGYGMACSKRCLAESTAPAREPCCSISNDVISYRHRNDHRWFGLGVGISSDSDSSPSDDFEGRTIKRRIYEPKTYVAGIEAHIQLACERKIFCSCKSTATAIAFSSSKYPGVYQIDSARNRIDLFDKLHDIIKSLADHVPSNLPHKPFIDNSHTLSLEDYIMRYSKSINIGSNSCVNSDESEKMYLEENKYKCPTCTGEVGSTPYLSPIAVLYGIAACKMFDCNISNTLSFDRKSYDYFDLPKGYQITQVKNPLGTQGSVKLDSGRIIKVRQVHLEEDTAKITENDDALDYNRSGIGLVEVVTEAVEMTESEIVETCTKIYDTVMKGGLCNGKMHQGNVRFDINLSFGSSHTRVEIKNLNSFNRIKRAIRQLKHNDIEGCKELGKNERDNMETVKLLKTLLSNLQDETQFNGTKGNSACGMTLEWNQKEKKLEVSRDKYGRESYINSLDPNIPVLSISNDIIEQIGACISDNRNDILNNSIKKYCNIPTQLLNVINKHYTWIKYFDEFADIMKDYKVAAKFFVNILLPSINSNPEIGITPQKFADLLNCVADNFLNLDTVKRILPDLIANWDGDIMEYIEKHDLKLLGKEETVNIVKEYLRKRSVDVASLRNNKSKINDLTGSIVASADYRISYKLVKCYLSDMCENELNDYVK